MSSILAIVSHADGPRLYIARHRIHHGTFGLAALLWGAWMAWRDRRDWREWACREVLR